MVVVAESERDVDWVGDYRSIFWRNYDWPGRVQFSGESPRNRKTGKEDDAEYGLH